MKFEPENEHIMLRHDISNNGLYDVWSLWNDSKTDTETGISFFRRAPIRLEDRFENRSTISGVVDHQIDIKLAPHRFPCT